MFPRQISLWSCSDAQCLEVYFENFAYFEHFHYEHERFFFWGCHLKCVVYPVFKVKSSHFILIVSHRQILVWSWIDTYLKEIYLRKWNVVNILIMSMIDLSFGTLI